MSGGRKGHTRGGESANDYGRHRVASLLSLNNSGGGGVFAEVLSLSYALEFLFSGTFPGG